MTPMRPAQQLPKLCGADVELANFIVGLEPRVGGGAAARALLAEIPGVPARGGRPAPAGARSNPQDVGRKFLVSNGGLVYVDLEHLEICLPEVRSALEFVAAWRALLDLVEEARAAANRALPQGRELHVLVNN